MYSAVRIKLPLRHWTQVKANSLWLQLNAEDYAIEYASKARDINVLGQST